MSETTLRKGSDMAASQPVDWLLASGYLARGKVNLLVGDEGIGKSLWGIRAAASISSGKPWGPFDAHKPEDVVIIATEDGWEDTVRPRLEVAEADLDRIHVPTTEDGTPAFTNVSVLSGIDPALVIVDSWIDTVPGGLLVKDAQKCRQALRPWKNYAAEKHAAVLLFAHTNRSPSESSRDTYGLSGALRQLVRSALYAMEDPDTSALVVGPDKANLATKPPAQRFARTSIERFTPTADSDGTVARLDYLGSDALTISDLLAKRQAKPTKGTEEIDGWLSSILADGRMRSTELDKLAEEAGFGRDKLKRARRRLGVKAVREGDEWFSELKSARGQECKSAEITERTLGAGPVTAPPSPQAIEKQACRKCHTTDYKELRGGLCFDDKSDCCHLDFTNAYIKSGSKLSIPNWCAS